LKGKSIMKAYIPRKGKTLADKLLVNRARSEQDWVMSGVNLGIRLCLCTLSRRFGFGKTRMLRVYEDACRIYDTEWKPDPEYFDAQMSRMLELRMGSNWESDLEKKVYAPLTVEQLKKLDGGYPIWDSYLNDFAAVRQGEVRFFGGGHRGLEDGRYYRHKPEEDMAGRNAV